MTYIPAPGSAVETAIAFIAKRGSARSKEIGEAIGREAKQISAILEAAVANGALVVCVVAVPGKPTQKEYRISGGGAPVPFTINRAARNVAPAEPRGASRPRVTGKLLRAAAKGRQRTAKPDRIIPENIPSQESIRSATNFRCGVFSDGSLVLRLRDGSLAELSPDDTRALLDYLDRSLLREGA